MNWINENNISFKNMIDPENNNLSDNSDIIKNEIIIKKSDIKAININKDIIINTIKPDPDLYYKKMTLIFGGSQTGKTTIVKNILYLLKHKIPTVFIIAPTNSSNNEFTNLVPQIMIKSYLDQKWLENLWNRQNDAAEIYELVNNLDRLKKIFNLSASKAYKDIEADIVNNANKTLNAIKKLNKNTIEKKQKRNQTTELKNSNLKRLYKQQIRKNKNIILKQLTQTDELLTLKYLDLNPNIILLLDDCASQFKSWYKKCNVIKKIFYEGRHKYFTTIITAQDDKEIDSELRKNAMINIFTSSQAAIANFERSSNSYPKEIKTKAKLCIQKIFEIKDNNTPNYKKMVYLKENAEPFKYIIADLFDDFKMCCDSLWMLSDRLEKGKTKYNKNNKFIKNL